MSRRLPAVGLLVASCWVLIFLGPLISGKSWTSAIDRHGRLLYHPTPMTKPNLDELQRAYKAAVEQWVAAIRAEEALATPDHSETAMERWDRADFSVQDFEKQAREARDAYKEGLRQLHYGI